MPNLPVPEPYKTIPVDEVLKFHLSGIQRYLKCVVVPVSIIVFVGSFICARRHIAPWTAYLLTDLLAASRPQIS